MTTETLDLVVIGAGVFGLGAARQYLAHHAEDNIAIIDSASGTGGVWASSRAYPGIKSNSVVGVYEYPDFPIPIAAFGLKESAHIPGGTFNMYLEAYCFRNGLNRFIRLDTKVLSAEHQSGGGWILELEHVRVGTWKVFARKVIIATGQRAEEFMPWVEGQEVFGRPIFHEGQFTQHKETIETAQRVAVVGTSKIARDAIYAYGTKGVKVDWIIRPNGQGQTWLVPGFIAPLRRCLDKLASNRIVNWFVPCIWDQSSGVPLIRQFWHNNPITRFITNTFWNIVGFGFDYLVGYGKYPQTAKLRPTTDFLGSGTDVLNYDTDFLELIRDGIVKIHRAEVSHLSQGKLHLDNRRATVLDSDALLLATGWKKTSSIKLLPEGIESDIGLPHRSALSNEAEILDEDLANYRPLKVKADREIAWRFPSLKNAKANPRHVPITKAKAFSAPSDEEDPLRQLTPSMLYRFMVPANPSLLRHRDLAFSGSANFGSPLCAYVQGLWINAYFDGKLDRDPGSAAQGPGKLAGERGGVTMDAVRYEAVLHSRFKELKYPDPAGQDTTNLLFEAMPYLDMLMADLGLRAYRKSPFWKEFAEAYGPEDYKSINDEWRTNHD